MYNQLRSNRTLLPTLDRLAKELKASHEAWMDRLAKTKPGSDPSQIAAEALEMALQQQGLSSEPPPGRERSAVPGRGNGVPPSSYADRVKASQVRSPRTLFDDAPPPEPAAAAPEQAPAHSPPASPSPPLTVAAGEKAKARDILAAIRTLKQIEQEQRPATPQERPALARFGGFGPVALSIFPDPVTGRYKDASWQAVGEELRSLLTDEEYDSAKRTTFNAFYTSSTVILAMYQGLKRLGVPDDAQVLEPGCGPGRFLYLAPKGMRFIGVELDSVSGRIAKALHPSQDIRIENFRDTRLPEIDAAIGNVPFADVKLTHRGQRFSLHDYFFAKSADALRPGGVLALVTSHYTLDKQNASLRELLADQADFLGRSACPPTPSNARAPASSRTSCSCASERPARPPHTQTPNGSPSRRWKSKAPPSRSTAIS